MVKYRIKESVNPNMYSPGGWYVPQVKYNFFTPWIDLAYPLVSKEGAEEYIRQHQTEKPKYHYMEDKNEDRR